MVFFHHVPFSNHREGCSEIRGVIHSIQESVYYNNISKRLKLNACFLCAPVWRVHLLYFESVNIYSAIIFQYGACAQCGALRWNVKILVPYMYKYIYIQTKSGNYQSEFDWQTDILHWGLLCNILVYNAMYEWDMSKEKQ